MDENIGNKEGKESKRHPSGRAFILTENTLVYEAEPEESSGKRENQPTVVSIHSALPVKLKGDWRDAFFKWTNVVLATFTYVVIIYYTQAAYIQIQQTMNANKLAEKANRDAWTLAEQAREVAIASDRPWVGLSDFEPKRYTINTPANVVATVQNAGKRPGRIFDMEMSRNWYKDFPASPYYEKLASPPSRTVILPATVMLIPNTFFISQTEFQERYAKGEKFYVYGRISYTDVRTNESHLTHFCEYFEPAQQAFYVCSFYNSID